MAVNVCNPRLLLQSDWNISLRQPRGRAWVICQLLGKQSKHGELQFSTSNSNETEINATENFKVVKFTKKWVTISHEKPDCNCTFIVPEKQFSNIHQKSVLSLDVSSGGFVVSSCVDNKLRLWDSNTGDIRRELEGHDWDVYCVKFFRSGLVVISGSADMKLKIWSAETGQSPVSLIGHTAAITDVQIVGIGRNVVSVGKDGTARLWDCGKSDCLDVIYSESEDLPPLLVADINCCLLHDLEYDLGEPDNTPSEREILTKNKLLLIGDESGKIKGYSLYSRKEVFLFNYESAINCCASINKTTIVFGAQDGSILFFKLQEQNGNGITLTLNCVFNDSGSAVLKLMPFKEGILIARADGTCLFYTVNGQLQWQLSGPDCDPIYCITTDGNYIFSGCRDAIIRKYSIPKHLFT